MESKEYGSGYFGKWITDAHGLPAYKYTCNQLKDGKAKTVTNEKWRNSTEHLHQVGNDRVVGVASNFGHVQLRQDEGAPKFLNDYNPEEKQYGGGLGYLISGDQLLSTYYGGDVEARNFERVFGIGYYQKKVSNADFKVEQVIFAPYGDDPLLISEVTIENVSTNEREVRWIEYWGTQLYEFSFKAYIQSSFSKKHPSIHRREFADKFNKDIVSYKNQGVTINHLFSGYSKKEKRAWKTLKFLANTLGKKITGGNVKEVVEECHFDDENPPITFLASLTGDIDTFSTGTDKFFGKGTPYSPEGIFNPLPPVPEETSASRGILLEKKLVLKPGEKKTIQFAFGYGYSNEEIETLISKYEQSPDTTFGKSCEQWKHERIQLTIPGDAWVDRELTWHNYYLRGNFTYDSFFKEHILSQGHVYQYLIGFQGASRDPLQHVLPFIYTNPDYAKEVLRYTLKTVYPSGEIPYGIVGAGVIMPSPFVPSDLELWLIWVTSEYVLANRDLEFLEETVPLYPVYGKKVKHLKVKDVLKLCYRHFVTESGTGKHGLQRISNGDWNDMVVHGYVHKDKVKDVQKQGESVLNAAMAIYTLRYFKELLIYLGDVEYAEEVGEYAEAQRLAVSKQWAGKWFKRAWLSEEYGWIGEKMLWLEPQPWAILGDAADDEKLSLLLESMNKEVRNPSKIGAMVCNQTDEKKAESNGSGTNAGIWPSINGTLIMALSKVDGALAWDEWKKNTLAMHAESYPHLWYGIWSGPDTYNSELSKTPGGTGFVDPEDEKKSEDAVSQLTPVNWTDFPVMNMYPHAWPLYNITSLMGLHFSKDGIIINPKLPIDEYFFETPLIGYSKANSEISGWYDPKTEGKLKIRIKLKPELASQYSKIEINGKSEPISMNNGLIEFWAESKANQSIKWRLLQ